MTFPRRFAITQRFTLGAPRNIVVSNDGQRVVFSRSTAGDDPVNRLWTLDLDQPGASARMVADPVALASGSSGSDMTDAERARRERAREAGSGIVSYVANADTTAALWVQSGRIMQTNLDTGTSIEIAGSGDAYGPRWSPDGTSIAYVAGNELRVTNTDGDDRLLVGPAPDEAQVSWGSAEFIAAEEMGRSRGFWWGPDNKRLLVARVDTSDVPVWWISNPTAPGSTPRSMPYPAAGATNATVDLFIVDLDGTRTAVDWRGGEFEYLARASWGTNSGITLTAQTRDQKTLAVLAVDADTGAVTELHRETDDAWVELMPGLPTWAGGELVVGTTHPDDGDTVTIRVGDQTLGAPGFQVRSVLRCAHDHIVVTGTHEPTELHVARLPLNGGPPEFLTSVPGVHRCTIGGSGDAETVAMVTSSLDGFGTTTRIRTAAPNSEILLESFAEIPTVQPDPQMVSVGSTGLRTAVLLPANHDGSDLPVLMDPYGGPHAQRVQHARNLYLTSQWFADQGFAVIVTDGRGTPARGAAWERSVYHDLAQPVLDDQVTAIAELADQFPLDTGKVAIRGWSFGGYLAALAAIRRPDVFHAGIAGAPVTDWRLYDTHYTERYLGNPSLDDAPYAANDLCAEAADLTQPLLLIHGLADDNVVAAHTLTLSQALLEAGRPHEVLPLSGVSHMTPQEKVAENLLLLQLTFLRRSLDLPVS